MPSQLALKAIPATQKSFHHIHNILAPNLPAKNMVKGVGTKWLWGAEDFFLIFPSSLLHLNPTLRTHRENLLLEMKALCTYSLPNQRGAEGKTDTERLILLSRAFSLMAFIEVTRAKERSLKESFSRRG